MLPCYYKEDGRRRKGPPEYRRSFVRYFFFRFLGDCFGAAS